MSALLSYHRIMRRAERLLRIIQILRRHRRPVRGQLMAEEVEVSLRTLYRDIADMITDGVPIRGEAGIGYVLGEGYDVPPLMFNADELEAVMLGLRWVERRGDKDLARAAQDTIAKIGAVLPEPLKPFLFDSGLLAPPIFTKTEDSVDVASLRQAIREQRKVELLYRDESGKDSVRVVWPIGISYFDAQRLLIAWCELRGDFRSFRTDRMTKATVSTVKYVERRKVLLKRWMDARKREAAACNYDALA
jgi:predicted DNA-binding transcriptional regulator YafY